MTCMRHRKADAREPRHAAGRDHRRRRRRMSNARDHHQIIVTIVAAVIVQVAVITILTEVMAVIVQVPVAVAVHSPFVEALANIQGLHNTVMVELRVTITNTDEKVMETDGKHVLAAQVTAGSTIVTRWAMTRRRAPGF